VVKASAWNAQTIGTGSRKEAGWGVEERVESKSVGKPNLVPPGLLDQPRKKNQFQIRQVSKLTRKESCSVEEELLEKITKNVIKA